MPCEQSTRLWLEQFILKHQDSNMLNLKNINQHFGMRNMIILLLTIFKLPSFKKTVQNVISILKLVGSIIVLYIGVCILMIAGIYYVSCFSFNLFVLCY